MKQTNRTLEILFRAIYYMCDANCFNARDFIAKLKQQG